MGKSNEQIISEFLQSAYSDEKLAALLAHAEDGKLSYDSCCCLVGIPAAEHALMGLNEWCDNDDHCGSLTREQEAAELAFCGLGIPAGVWGDEQAEDSARRVNLIPLIKAEMQRRERERSSLSPTLLTTGVNG